MIAHFIRFDFKSHRMYWIILAACVAFSCFLQLRNDEFFIYGSGFLFMFSFLGVQQVTGVSIRSQNSMSRNYLLALPIKRSRLYFNNQVRVAIYLLPFLIFLAFAPMLFPKQFVQLATITRLMNFYLVSILLSFAMVNLLILSTLMQERVNTKLNPMDRFKTGLLMFIVTLVVVMIGISISVLSLDASSRAWASAPFALLYLVCIYHYAKERWIGAI